MIATIIRNECRFFGFCVKLLPIRHKTRRGCKIFAYALHTHRPEHLLAVVRQRNRRRVGRSYGSFGENALIVNFAIPPTIFAVIIKFATKNAVIITVYPFILGESLLINTKNRYLRVR